MTNRVPHHILTVTVENKPGVLSRVAGLFSRRAFAKASSGGSTSSSPSPTGTTSA